MKHIRKSGIYFILTGSGITFFAMLFFYYPHLNAQYRQNALQEKIELVKKLGITDLCLFTEAPYTRHLSLADNFSAFKDSPMVFEHFPSGSMTTPPQLAGKRIHENPLTADRWFFYEPAEDLSVSAVQLLHEDLLMGSGQSSAADK